jgi:hypothetical protein
MLENSFVHLPGIGPETELKLWSLGLNTWADLSNNVQAVFKGQKARKIAAALEASQSAHESGEYHYFHSLFKGSEMWRLFPSLLKKGLAKDIAYLDIETTGLGFPPECKSTTIAVLFQGVLQVEHDPSKKLQLLQRIDREAKLLVTFNGGPFDLPFLRREFHLSLSQAHLDLRFWFARLDLRGGLKKIQQSFRQVPQRGSMDIDGFDAVKLWHLHQRGVPRALDTLMTYNAEDTVVLEQLVYCGLNIEAQRRPTLALPVYELPPAPAIATQICPEVYRLLRFAR